MSQNVADCLVEIMVDAGVRHVYGIVGDSANPIVDAIRRQGDRLRFVPMRNEESGAFAAGADAQITGHPAAVLGSSGPGTLHLLNGLYDCDRNAAPVFAIATHIPRVEIGTRYFQETRPEWIFADCTRYCGYISSSDQLPRIAELAMQGAILDRGVGMVILPGDIGAMKIERPLLSHPVAKSRPAVLPLPHDLDHVAKRINQANRIAIFGGNGCRQARSEVVHLAEVLKAPIAYTYRGKDILEADNPFAIGMTGLLGCGGAHTAFRECDLLLMLGTDFPYHKFMPENATIVQIDDRPAHLGRRAKVDVGLVGDIGETLRALIPMLQPQSDSTFLNKMLTENRRAVVESRTYVTHQGSGKTLRPEMVADALSELAAENAVFTCDTGMCNVWAARYLRMKRHQRLLASFSHGSMANAMPQAIGAKLADPARQVIALCGDGGLAMLMGELLTIKDWNIPVKLMVFNNSTLGMVRAEMQVCGFIPFGTDTPDTHFADLAKAIGIHSERVERPEDIRPAIQRALDFNGPALLDFVTDPRALAMPPKTTAEQVAGFALSMTKTVFQGDTAEVLETIKSNIRNVKQVL